MENSKNKTDKKVVDVIVISDDEDSEDSHLPNSCRVETNNLKTSIFIDLDDIEEVKPAVLGDAIKKPDENCQVLSSAKYVFSPEKFKISKDGIKKLKATVKLTKLDLRKPLKDQSPVKVKVENDRCDERPTTTCSSTENRDAKKEVSK